MGIAQKNPQGQLRVLRSALLFLFNAAGGRDVRFLIVSVV